MNWWGETRKCQVRTYAKSHKDHGVRCSAAQALGEIGGGKAINHLIKALEDKNQNVRGITAEALGEIGGGKVINHLIKALEDKDQGVRSCAAWALREIGGDKAVKHLIKALEDESQGVRGIAAEALGEIGGGKVIEHITRALEDKDNGVRSSAAWALGKIGGDQAINHLIKALADKNDDVRGSAVRGLGEIGSDKATESLIKALEDTDAGVRFNAALALGKIGGDQAAEILTEAIESDIVPGWLVATFLPVSLGSKALPRLMKLVQRQPAALLNIVTATQEHCRFYNPALLPIDRRFCIVHLSDLHFGKVDRAEDLYVGLLLELKKDLDLQSLEALVISGDVVNRSNGQGYSQAQTFLSKIAKRFNLRPNKVLIVPGNHDVDHDLSEAAYSVKRKEPNDAIDEHQHIDGGKYIEVKDEAKYKRRFAQFRAFFKKAFKVNFPTEYSQQVTWREYPDQKVLMVGLNSAWELDHHYRWRSGLYPDALNQAIERATEDGFDDWLKIVVWHHPIKSEDAEETKPNKSWIRDDGFMDRLAVAGFSMILHGHAHEGGARRFPVDTGKKKYTLHVVAAGTLDADEDELTPGSFWQYNIINVTGTKVSVECRKRVNPRGISRPDKTWLKNAPDKSTYDFDLPDVSD